MSPGNLLSPRQDLLTRALDRCAAVSGFAFDLLRHARYRRAELRRLPAVDPPSGSYEWQNLPVRGREQPVLVGRPPLRVDYDVMLPEGAVVRSWCSLAPGSDGSTPAEAAFSIEVRTTGGVTSVRRVVRGRSLRRAWHLIEARVPASGPARITLGVAATPDHEQAVGGARWGNPRIESPRPFAELLARLPSAIGRSGSSTDASSGSDDPRQAYALWVRVHRPSRRALRSQREWSRRQTRRLSLITCVADADSSQLSKAAAALQEQTYPHWEWLLVVSSPAPQVDRSSRRDPRIRFVEVPANTPEAEGWNAALGTATGEFAGILGVHDRLSRDALHTVATTIAAAPTLDLLYSDEDRFTAAPRRRNSPRFKPDWSPDLLLASNYIGRLAMFRIEHARTIGGFRPDHPGAEEWDLFLRLSRITNHIHRIPACLYHATAEVAASDVGPTQCAAVRDHLRERRLAAEVSAVGGACQATWPIVNPPLVSIVIPNRNAADILTKCVTGLLNDTRYQPLELVIVDNDSTDEAVFELYRAIEGNGQGRVVPFGGRFNFSAACNAGAMAAQGDLLLFLNNEWTLIPEVGIVGPKLLYPDGSIQHAGVVFGIGLVAHIFSRAAEGTSTLFGSPDCYRNYLAVTGACQMMRRQVFHQLGGFDERMRLSFSDVLLCLEAWRAGYRVVYTPYARLIHHESFTRKREDSAEDMEMLARYLDAHTFTEDPFFHPELNPQSHTPIVRSPFEAAPRQVIADYIRRVLSSSAFVTDPR
jgi:GT2 family glycosyltransferase